MHLVAVFAPGWGRKMTDKEEIKLVRNEYGGTIYSVRPQAIQETLNQAGIDTSFGWRILATNKGRVLVKVNND